MKTESEEKKEDPPPQQKDDNNPENTLREVRGFSYSLYRCLVVRITN